jgi:hypothetical protein
MLGKQIRFAPATTSDALMTTVFGRLELFVFSLLLVFLGQHGWYLLCPASFSALDRSRRALASVSKSLFYLPFDLIV